MTDTFLHDLKTQRDELLAELTKYETAIAALEGSSGGKRRAGRPAGKRTRKKTARKARIRGKATAITKTALTEMLSAGMTGKQIAAKFGVSMPTVHNYKAKFGLTNPRGKGERKAGARRKTASGKKSARKKSARKRTARRKVTKPATRRTGGAKKKAG